jgi:hypothetical protein
MRLDPAGASVLPPLPTSGARATATLLDRSESSPSSPGSSVAPRPRRRKRPRSPPE